MIPDGQSIQNGTMLLIQEDDDLESFIAEAAYVVWNGEKIGDRFFVMIEMRFLTLMLFRKAILILSAYESWIGNHASFLSSLTN